MPFHRTRREMMHDAHSHIRVEVGVAPLPWTPSDCAEEVFAMAKTHPPYAPEFRRQMVELVRSGRSAGELAREFGCCAQTIRNWVRQTGRDEGRRDDGLTSPELEELRRLRRENRRLREEREILKKRPRSGLLGRPARCRGGLRAREGEPGRACGVDDVSGAGRLPQRVLRVARPWAFFSCEARRGAARRDSEHPPGVSRHLRGASGAC